MSVTIGLVVTSDSKISATERASSIAAAASAVTTPRRTAAARTRAASIPAPSSASVISTLEPSTAPTEIVMCANAGFPTRTRSAVGSTPWSAALRTRWISGSFSSSSTRLSISTSPPFTTRSMSLPRSRPTCRARSGNASVMVATGSISSCLAPSSTPSTSLSAERPSRRAARWAAPTSEPVARSWAAVQSRKSATSPAAPLASSGRDAPAADAAPKARERRAACMPAQRRSHSPRRSAISRNSPARLRAACRRTSSSSAARSS